MPAQTAVDESDDQDSPPRESERPVEQKEPEPTPERSGSPYTDVHQRPAEHDEPEENEILRDRSPARRAGDHDEEPEEYQRDVLPVRHRLRAFPADSPLEQEEEHESERDIPHPGEQHGRESRETQERQRRHEHGEAPPQLDGLHIREHGRSPREPVERPHPGIVLLASPAAAPDGAGDDVVGRERVLRDDASEKADVSERIASRVDRGRRRVEEDANQRALSRAQATEAGLVCAFTERPAGPGTRGSAAAPSSATAEATNRKTPRTPAAGPRRRRPERRAAHPADPGRYGEKTDPAGHGERQARHGGRPGEIAPQKELAGEERKQGEHDKKTDGCAGSRSRSPDETSPRTTSPARADETICQNGFLLEPLLQKEQQVSETVAPFLQFHLTDPLTVLDVILPEPYLLRADRLDLDLLGQRHSVARELEQRIDLRPIDPHPRLGVPDAPSEQERAWTR